MNKTKRTTLAVQGVTIAVQNRSNQDYISLTDIARYRNSQEPFAVINNWMRSRSTIEFLGLWEKLCNPVFKPLEFERFRNEAGSNYFVLSPHRVTETDLETRLCDHLQPFLLELGQRLHLRRQARPGTLLDSAPLFPFRLK